MDTAPTTIHTIAYPLSLHGALPILSVSDVVALKRSGEVSYHYVDSFGFKDVPFYDVINTIIEQKQNEQMKIFAFNAKESPKDVFDVVSKDPALKRTLEDVIAISNLNENLDATYSFEQLSTLSSYCRDVWLKYEEVSLAQVSDFACEAINHGIVKIEDISRFSRQEFYHALSDDNLEGLRTEKDFLPEVLHKIGRASCRERV